jgi:hypothetical protein
MKKYIIISLTFLFFGCYQDSIQPDLLENYKSKMIVNAIFTNGQPAKLQLTNSSAVMDSSGLKGIPNATVMIETVDETKTMSPSSGDFNYSSDFLPTSGKPIKLSVRHPDYVNVSSTVIVPVNVNAISTLTENGGLDTSGLPGDLIQVSFNDPGNKSNFYKLNIFYWNQTIGDWIPMSFTKSDPSLTGYNSYVLSDAGVIFSDELFNGSNKIIQTVAPNGLVSSNPDNKYKVEFSHITSDFFEYYRSIQRADDAKEISFNGGFNNAVVIHSNIDNGLGILAVQNTSETILK